MAEKYGNVSKNVLSIVQNECYNVIRRIAYHLGHDENVLLNRFIKWIQLYLFPTSPRFLQVQLNPLSKPTRIGVSRRFRVAKRFQYLIGTQDQSVDTIRAHFTSTCGGRTKCCRTGVLGSCVPWGILGFGSSRVPGPAKSSTG